MLPFSRVRSVNIVEWNKARLLKRLTEMEYNDSQSDYTDKTILSSCVDIDIDEYLNALDLHEMLDKIIQVNNFYDAKSEIENNILNTPRSKLKDM
jgi:hypothetical protein